MSKNKNRYEKKRIPVQLDELGCLYHPENAPLHLGEQLNNLPSLKDVINRVCFLVFSLRKKKN